jgi:hypothetical protein
MLEGIPPAAKPSRTAGSPVEYLEHRLHQHRETRKADLPKHFVRELPLLLAGNVSAMQSEVQATYVFSHVTNA